MKEAFCILLGLLVGGLVGFCAGVLLIHAGSTVWFAVGLRPGWHIVFGAAAPVVSIIIGNGCGVYAAVRLLSQPYSN